MRGCYLLAMKSTRMLVLALGLATAGAGCSSAEPAPGPSSTPQPSASVSASALTREEGAKQYLKLVEPFNRELDRCLPVLNPILESGSASSDAVPKVRTACSGVADANRQFAVSLGQVSWPSEARESVNQLVDELHADQLAWEGVGKAKTVSDLVDPKYPLTEDGGGADLVRAHLGLPPVEEVEE